VGFRVQQQVTPEAVLTANYVGPVGRKLDIDEAYKRSPATWPDSDKPQCGSHQLWVPFDNIGATAYDLSVGKSNYQAFQMSFKGNAQHGLTYLVSYTWSKSLDLGRTGWYRVEGCSIQNPYNIQADKGRPRRIFRTSSPSHGCIRFLSLYYSPRAG
jgi:hypothetical protein